MRWKVSVVTGLFVLGALCFIAGYFPVFADLFWFLWILGCSACIVGVILAFTVNPGRHYESPRIEDSEV